MHESTLTSWPYSLWHAEVSSCFNVPMCLLCDCVASFKEVTCSSCFLSASTNASTNVWHAAISGGGLVVNFGIRSGARRDMTSVVLSPNGISVCSWRSTRYNSQVHRFIAFCSLERGSSAVECRTRNQVSPGANPPLILFRRRLGILFSPLTPQLTVPLPFTILQLVVCTRIDSYPTYIFIM